MNLPTFAFYQRLSPRERLLTLLVAGSVFFFVNLFALRGLATSFRELNEQRRQKSLEAGTMAIYLSEQPRWTERMTWLKNRQPPLANRDVAGVQLQEQIKTVADQQKVIISSQQILPAPAGAAAQSPAHYRPLTVRFDTKGDWLGMVHFLAAIQRPESFIAFESASLHTDPSDPKVMMGEFRIAKWYAPAASR